MHGYVELASERLELVHRGGAAEVGGDEQRALLALAEMQGEFGGGGRLAGALQSDEQQRGGQRRAGDDGAVPLAEQFDELVVNEFDDLLAWGDAAQRVGFGGALLDAGGEVAGDLEVDVGLEEREADFAQRLVDVGVGEPPLVAEPGEHGREFVGERVEHRG